MDKQLNDIITYYEEEKSKLSHLIKDYILEQEYLNAHIISKEIFNVNQKLERLHILNDALYDEKIKLESINTLENLSNSESSTYLQDYYRDLISARREELSKLKFQKAAINQPGNEHIFENVLNMLINKKIRMFRIIFDRGENFYCELKFVKGDIEIAVPRIRYLLKIFWFGEYKFEQFLKLGFEFNEKTNKLSIKLPGRNSGGIADAKIILSRIVFEILSHSQLENNVFIEYQEKNNR